MEGYSPICRSMVEDELRNLMWNRKWNLQNLCSGTISEILSGGFRKVGVSGFLVEGGTFSDPWVGLIFG